MNRLTEEQDRELRRLLVRLKMASARTSVALSDGMLLIEGLRWTEALNEITGAILALDVPLEVAISTALNVKGEVPGSVFIAS